VIGSLSPSHLRIIIRSRSRESDGVRAASRAFTVLAGLAPTLLVLLVDTLKGLAVLLISLLLLDVNGNWLLLPLACLLAGHLFPFYLGFRSSRDVMVAAAPLLYFLIVLIRSGRMPLISVSFLLALVLSVAFATRTVEFVACVTMPMLLYAVLIHGGTSYPAFPIVLLGLFIMGIGIFETLKSGIFKVRTDLDVRWWRVWMRPAASLILLLYFFVGKAVILLIMGGVALLFIAVDLARFFSRRADELFVDRAKVIFKRSERRKFSSISLFLIATFIVLFSFERDVAFLSLSFLIYGDLLAKLFGIRFGRTRLVGNRTLEGSLSYFAGSLAAGYIIATLLGIDLWLVLIGAVAATLIELFSTSIDDNFTVGIISGVIISAIRFFGYFGSAA
jgi:glycerol-3-phosphate acyltransferase PlsY